MRQITTYDRQGRVIATMSVPECDLAVIKEPYVKGHANPETMYIKDGRITRRPKMPATLTGNVLSGLPVPCAIHINSAMYQWEEPDCQLDLTYPGQYAIRIEKWPYQDQTFTHTTEAPAPASPPPPTVAASVKVKL